MPTDLDQLRADARAEGFHFIERLADEWASGTNQFAREGEALLVARVRGALAGVGGLTQEAALPAALRMRRFYVRPAYRRFGIARQLALTLLAGPRPPGTAITVNAATRAAPAFWEALGFQPDRREGFTHILQPGEHNLP